MDEPVDLFGGYSYLKWGDFRVNPEQPPFMKIWAALPLLLLHLPESRPSGLQWDLIPQTSPTTDHTVNVAADFLFVRNDADTLLFYGRLQMIILAYLLATFIFLWSKELFGLEAAVAVVFVYCLDPNILALSPIIHTDFAFTAMFFIASYFLWRTLRNLTWFNLICTALFFGFAVITKFAYTAMFFVWVCLGIAHIVSSKPQGYVLVRRGTFVTRWSKTAAFVGIVICCVISGYLLIWSSYQFRYDAVPGGTRPLPIASEVALVPTLRGAISLLTTYHLFPEAWIYGQLYIFNNLQRPAYLLGSYSEQGFWSYFPIAFAVKTPVPTLLLLSTTVGIWVFKKQQRRAGFFLLLVIIPYFALAMWSHMNIGLRHILPIYPFLFVLLGGTVAQIWKSKNNMAVRRAALGFLAVWYLWVAVKTFPDYLAYFNELAGGPDNGPKVLLDSNIDWGQDLKGLRRWMTRSNVSKIQFYYFGTHNIAVPQYYRIDADYLPGSWVAPNMVGFRNEKAPEYLAVSVNHLFGRFLAGEGSEDFVKPFRALKPAANLGYSIRVYQMADVIRQLRERSQRSADSADAHADLGSVLENQGNMAEAVREYREAIKLDGHSTKARYHLAMILAKQGRLEEAIEHLHMAAESRPRDAEIHYDLAILLAAAGRLETAIQEFERTINLDPTHTVARYNLGMLLEKKGDLKGAIHQLLEALNTDRTFIRAHYQLGLILANAGKLDDAVVQFKEALQIDPEFAEAHEGLARALLVQGKRREAAMHLEETVRLLKSRGQKNGSPSL